MDCTQQGCEVEAVVYVDWPGRDKIPYCFDHAAWAKKILQNCY